MKSGFNIEWTQNARKELEKTIEYLEENFSKKEIKKLVQKIENITELISQNQNLFPKSKSNNIHKVVILKFNTLYYRTQNNSVEILSFFSNRQNPIKGKYRISSLINNHLHTFSFDHSLQKIKIYTDIM